MKRRIALSLSSSLLCVTVFAATAQAAKPWVDRTLTLPPLHLSADAGLGFGQYTIPVGKLPTEMAQKPGIGANLEAAVGLPIFGELNEWERSGSVLWGKSRA